MAKKVLIVVQRIDSGGVANAINNFLIACSRYSDEIKFDVVSLTGIIPSSVKAIYDKYGARIIPIKRIRTQGLRSYYKQIKGIMHEQGPYSAVHIHTAYFIWVTARAAKKEGIKVRIGHAHGQKGILPWYISFWYEPIARFLNRKYCTHMLGCSYPSGKWTFGKMVEFLPNILPENNPLKTEGEFVWAYPDNSLKIAYIGAISNEIKNVGFMVPILKEIAKRRKVLLFFAGAGRYVEELIANFKSQGLDKNVVFLGYVRNVLELLKHIDVVIMPSKSEGMSLTLIETQIAGVPCVVSKGVPKTNDLQMNLFYQVNSWNTIDWAEKIEIAASVENKRYSAEERKLILQQIGYDSESIARRLIELYNLKR